jgi:hypothetical protein
MDIMKTVPDFVTTIIDVHTSQSPFVTLEETFQACMSSKCDKS